MVFNLGVVLEDLYNGKKTKISVQRNIICSQCKGKGGKEGAVQACRTCNGQGVRLTVRQMGPLIQQMQTTCPDCQGAGRLSARRTVANSARARR